jgi:hypothetical protein
MRVNAGWRFILMAIAAFMTPRAVAHPIVENAMQIVIDRQMVSIEARISMEEILMVEGDASAPANRWAGMVESHRAYLLKHLYLMADGKAIGGKVVASVTPDSSDKSAATLKMAKYRIEYALASPPKEVSIRQDFLREYSAWAASFVVQIKQSDDADYRLEMLTREKRFVFDCEWNAATTAPSPQAATASRTKVNFGAALKEYTVHGIGHIIGPISSDGWNWHEAGFDHLLFATALVLATRRLWDLVKVVTAFTLAHTITLTLSVLDWVTLSGHIVEPMIAASIVFVAFQNVFWPRQSRGSLRLVIAFGFGLFHGLGFAGGLKEAMSGMPGAGLAAALIGFSLGVEIGHQMVVLPLFGVLVGTRKWLEGPSKAISSVDMDDDARVLDYERREIGAAARLTLATRFASGMVGVCGAWYFLVALRIV